jgi:hypothetical protein
LSFAVGEGTGVLVVSIILVPLARGEIVALAAPPGEDKEELRAEEPLAAAAESEDTERVRTRGESVTTVPGTGVVVGGSSEEEERETDVEDEVLLTVCKGGLGEGGDIDETEVRVAGSAC